MRRIERIPEIMELVQKIWMKYPDLRFFQLCELISFKVSKGDNYYTEDDITLQVLKNILQEKQLDQISIEEYAAENNISLDILETIDEMFKKGDTNDKL